MDILYKKESLPMNDSEFKRYHESFMQNNHGTTMFHTFLSINFTVLCSIYCSITNRNLGPFQYVYEYIIIILPLICAHTVLSKYIYILNLVVLALLCYEHVRNYKKINFYKTLKAPNRFQTEKIQLVTCLRGLTYLITVFCILAVDFQDFPRYLAKTEQYGYSLMDTGVGLFVLMSGLVHKDVLKNNYSLVIKGNTKFISILVLLGMARLVSVKQFNYQEHVSEYGVHWNFFFTLAVCKLTSTLLLFFSNKTLLLSMATLVCHELILYNGIQKWVFSDVPRNTVLTANREGISSCLGYTSLYLFAAYLKTELNNKCVYRYTIMIKLVLGSICLWLMSYIIDYYRATSRTLANAGYCVYVSSIFLTMTTVFYYHEVLFQNQIKQLYFEAPKVLLHVNNNGLIYFLAANLLTGFVNMSMRTLLVSSEFTFFILNAYMIITIVLVVYLHRKGVKI